MLEMTTELYLASKAEEVLRPLSGWSRDCHAASLELVRAGVADRVARGWCVGISSQHSWAVVGYDCYSEDAWIVDAVAWSYQDREPTVDVMKLDLDLYVPHGGLSTIWDWGRPGPETDEYVELTPRQSLSPAAKDFLRMLGPLDARAWGNLATNAPVRGWPAAEILGAMDDTEALSGLVPVDRLGMLTMRNPGGVYLRKEDEVAQS